MLVHYKTTTRAGQENVHWTMAWNHELFFKSRLKEAEQRSWASRDSADVIAVAPITEREYRVARNYTYPDGNPTKRSRHETQRDS